jgi:hypothetical protein
MRVGHELVHSIVDDHNAFTYPKTSMLFGDAKASVSEVLGEVQRLWAKHNNSHTRSQ